MSRTCTVVGSPPSYRSSSYTRRWCQWPINISHGRVAFTAARRGGRRQLEVEYTRILLGLAKQPGTLGTIFREAQNRIQDPAKLKRLIHDLIDAEQWRACGRGGRGPPARSAAASRGP